MEQVDSQSTHKEYDLRFNNIDFLRKSTKALKALDDQLAIDLKKLQSWESKAKIVRETLIDLQKQIEIYKKKREPVTLPKIVKRIVKLPIILPIEMYRKLKHKLIYFLHYTFRPRIGVLHQYSSKFLAIPNSYYNEAIPSNPPSISIVTPTFNQGDFLERTILSIIEQKYPNLELIIQDGGSKDQTVDTIKNYASFIKHWESKEDEGQSNALNLGFQHTSGEIMAYLNSDDILLPGTLAYIARYFAEHPDIDVVYGHRIVIDEYDHEIGRWVLPPHNSAVLSWADYIPQETLFWRRSLWNKAGASIDESFKFAMDWDLLLRFRDAGAKFARLPRFLGAFRVHTEQKTSSQMANIGLREMQRLRKRYLGQYMPTKEIIKNLRWYQLQHLLFDSFYKMGILRY